MNNPVYIARQDEHPDYYSEPEPIEQEVSEMMQERIAMIENALNWQAEGPNRGVTITSNNYGNTDKFTIYCSQTTNGYTYGEFVDDGRVIDLVAGAKREKLAQLEKLQKEFESC